MNILCINYIIRFPVYAIAARTMTNFIICTSTMTTMEIRFEFVQEITVIWMHFNILSGKYRKCEKFWKILKYMKFVKMMNLRKLYGKCRELTKCCCNTRPPLVNCYEIVIIWACHNAKVSIIICGYCWRQYIQTTGIKHQIANSLLCIKG